MKEPVEEPVPAQGTTDSWPQNQEFGRVYQDNASAIYYLALRFLGDAQKAEDATHDVFLKAFRRWEQFRGESSVKTWLYRIAINHCRNLVQAWNERHMIASSDNPVWEMTASTADSPLRVLETHELGERIKSALSGISEEYRLLLLLVADQELSYEQIANLTDQTPDAVRGKLHRARKAFAAAFGKSE